MVPRRRAAGHGRRSAHDTPTPTGPSLAEITIYGLLAAAVAAGLLLLDGRPWPLAAAVLGGTAGLLAVLALTSSKIHPKREQAERRRRRRR
ncbi:hypothetical protein EF847_05560 [Actinobacteria bacterium YIM 96077]|uniref:Uncharacterized protein n=1 Tax=Phytoactinopolyspora halophila TaxID=1981511 RepID=A0A329QR32_9ACTN|nr:hypothetical protein [Phytoactinopolyspora halophila]AYY12250.1 hypothetical protein EF847_05560 [Actinobacteria bacterium YIM 96077]RAW13832.1 hypothetical protein DPM12_12595 [Phytoactinopolyspora halophila]